MQNDKSDKKLEQEEEALERMYDCTLHYLSKDKNIVKLTHSSKYLLT